MKVLHINCNYLDSWLHQNLIDSLKKQGIENQVFVPIYSFNDHIVKPKDYVVSSICFRKNDRIIYHLKQMKIMNSIRELIDFSGITCIHAYTLFTDGNVARKISKLFNLPFVVTVRNTDVNDFFKHMPHLRHIGVKVLLDANVIFFLSKSYMNKVIDKYIPLKYRKTICKKCFIIPNGIDNFWHKNQFVTKDYIKRERRFQKKQIHLLYVGGIDKNKNIRLTCKAKKVLENRGWKVELDVVGRIVDKKEFALIKSDINYFKQQTKEQLISFYRKTDLFVMPSHTETFGLVYVEAMTQGIPVLYTENEGFDGQFPEGYVGYHVNSKDEIELADKIVSICSNYKEISLNCINGSKKYNWDDIATNYIDIYKKIRRI